MSNNSLRDRRRTMANFYPAYGYGPWSCHFCGGIIDQIGRGSWDGNVHHLDHDVTNDDSSNLAIAHAVCHQRAHPITPELRLQISQKLKGRPSPTRGTHWSEERRAHHSTIARGSGNPFYGRSHAEVVLQKMRQPRRRERCTDCRREYALNWLQRHKDVGRCAS